MCTDVARNSVWLSKRESESGDQRGAGKVCHLQIGARLQPDLILQLLAVGTHWSVCTDPNTVRAVLEGQPRGGVERAGVGKAHRQGGQLGEH